LIPCLSHSDRQHRAREDAPHKCACGLIADARWNEPTREQMIAATEPTAEQVAKASAR